MRPQEIEIIFYKTAEMFSSQKKLCTNIAIQAMFTDLEQKSRVEMELYNSTCYNSTQTKYEILSFPPLLANTNELCSLPRTGRYV